MSKENASVVPSPVKTGKGHDSHDKRNGPRIPYNMPYTRVKSRGFGRNIDPKDFIGQEDDEE